MTEFKPLGSRTKNYVCCAIAGTTKQDAVKYLNFNQGVDEFLWPKDCGGYNSLLRSEIKEPKHE